MNISRAIRLCASTAALLLASASLLAQVPSATPAHAKQAGPATGTEKSPAMTREQAREDYAYAIGVEAYIYAYPLVEMYRVRYKRLFDPNDGIPSRLNEFHHVRELLDYKATSVVAPNNDTLYSTGWLDLAKEPIVLEVPASPKRFYVMQFMDFYTSDFAIIGTRTTGSAAGTYAIVGPNWKGELPKGLKRLDSPTNSVWLLGRTLIDGPEDLAAVHAQQDRYRLIPLTDWRNRTTPKPEPLPNMRPYKLDEPLQFFEFVNLALHENPPPAREAALMSVFGEIGVGPDKDFTISKLDPAIARGLTRAVQDGERIVAASRRRTEAVNGWRPPAANSGTFGDDYLLRAVTAKYALAALTPEEDYSFVHGLNDGNAMDGSHAYVLRFEKGQLPPVNAFWSVTMYLAPSGFLVDNPIHRYSIGDRTRGLKYDKDGSLTIYIQHKSPGQDKVSNWLPAPEGAFALGMRCYGPTQAILSGAWKPPVVVATEAVR
ncbi:MAG: DUF1254 domain-containing protein [Proteobacteria bacterium]|nr:DUF1254 domain-containing protein [Pseudomonadota bacterium]